MKNRQLIPILFVGALALVLSIPSYALEEVHGGREPSVEPGMVHVIDENGNHQALSSTSFRGHETGLVGRVHIGDSRTVSFWTTRKAVIVNDAIKAILKAGHDVTFYIDTTQNLHRKGSSLENYFGWSVIVEAPNAGLRKVELGKLATRLRRSGEIENGQYFGLIGVARALGDACAFVVTGK